MWSKPTCTVKTLLGCFSALSIFTFSPGVGFPNVLFGGFLLCWYLWHLYFSLLARGTCSGPELMRESKLSISFSTVPFVSVSSESTWLRRTFILAIYWFHWGSISSMSLTSFIENKMVDAPSTELGSTFCCFCGKLCMYCCNSMNVLAYVYINQAVSPATRKVVYAYIASPTWQSAISITIQSFQCNCIGPLTYCDFT